MVNVARRLTILACVVLVLVIAGLSAFWLYGAERLQQTVGILEANWRAQGGEISYENFRLDGFPMWFRIQVDKPMVARPHAHSPWRWEGPPVRMRMSPFAPRGRSLFPGKHRLDITLFGNPVTLAIEARDAEARYRGRSNSALYAVLGDTLSVGVNGQPPLTIGNLDFEVTRLRGVTDHLKPSAQFSFEIDNVALPQGSLPQQFRQRPIDLAVLQGQVLGPFTPDFNRAAAAAWRDTGGTVEIESLDLRWGPLKLVAVGTMALDENLQPLAALTATISGFNETIDALAGTGVLQKNEADSAKTLLGLLAKPPRLLGGPPEITVPVTIQNQRLSLGPVALMTLPLIEWPD
jgi:hypothetical protein